MKIKILTLTFLLCFSFFTFDNAYGYYGVSPEYLKAIKADIEAAEQAKRDANARGYGIGPVEIFNSTINGYIYPQIVLNKTGNSIFIPTRTEEEWRSVLNSPWSGIEIIPPCCGTSVNCVNKHGIRSPEWDYRVLPYSHIANYNGIRMAVYHVLAEDHYVCGYNITNQHWLNIAKQCGKYDWYRAYNGGHCN